jgi:aspartate 1-decarboxylase
MLKSKLHRARVTEANLEYTGSLAVDEDLMDMCGIIEFEKITVSNINNGERFETYIIPGRRGSGEVCLNGAAARKGVVGDRIIIFSYAYYDEEELTRYKPLVVVLSEDNMPVQYANC